MFKYRIIITIDMTIHTQQLKSGGVRMAYLAEQFEGAEEAVRRVLGIQSTPVSIGIPRDLSGAYIIGGPDRTVYYNPLTNLMDTACTVQVPKDNTPIVVAIRSTARLPNLERVIELALINEKLVPAGLIPIESTRDQIPMSYLRDY